MKFDNKNKILSTLKILVLIWIAATLTSLFFGGDRDFGSANVAVIPVNGIITTAKSGGLGSNFVSSDRLISSLSRAEKNPNIKAILLDINSPGGSGVASDEVAQKIKSIEKPVISVIRDLGASGAYWVASSTDYIFANKMSFTGSIGVIGSYLEFSGLLEEYNVTYQRFVSGRLKDFGSPFKEPTAEEIGIFQELLDRVRDFFIEEVALNRNLEIQEVEKIATGQVYLGVDAKQLNLIDELGTKQDALNYIESKLNISVEIVEYQDKKGLSDLLSDLRSPKIGNFINPTNTNLLLR